MNNVQEQLERYSVKLAAYGRSKSDAEYDNVKKEFFEEIAKLINEKKLTAVSLTEKLKKLSPEKRAKLFYRARNGSASADSHAAQWVARLYQSLNVALDKRTLAKIVESGINDDLALFIKNTTYQQWKRNRFNQNNIDCLEHELKAILVGEGSLSKLIKANIATNKENYIATILPQLFAKAPQYMQEVVNKMQQEHLPLIDKLIEKHQDKIDLLVQVAMTNPAFAEKVVTKNLDVFGYLSASMQNILLKSFAEKKSDIFDQLISKFTIDSSVAENHQQFIQQVVERLPGNVNELINEDNRLTAIKLINAYLDKNPGHYKAEFFNKLKERIRKKGLTFDVLNQALNEIDGKKIDRNKLFAKWTGAKNSRAAALYKEFYRFATLGKELNAEQVDNMINEGMLPGAASDEIVFVKKRIKEILANPAQAKSSKLGQAVEKWINYCQTPARILSYQKAREQADTEAKYQQALINKGLNEAAEQNFPLFDNQGHVLIKVKLNDKEIFCKLDVKGNKQLEQKFREFFLGNTADLILNSPERNSIIPLQEEMVFHTLLCWRTLQQKSVKIGIEFKEEDLNKLLQTINFMTANAVNQCLTQSLHDQKELNVAQFNQLLDGKRLDLAVKCRTLLGDTLFSSIPEARKVQFQDMVASLNTHDFTSQTATGLDYLRTDADNRIAARISATDYTAHDKKLGGENQALRLLKRNHYDAAANTVTPYNENNLDVRVPSIAVVNKNRKTAVQDVADKLKYSSNLLRDNNPAHQGPLVYNLLTSIPNIAYENFLERFFFKPNKKNKQRESANDILLGAHAFNKKQQAKGNRNNLVLIQNIPVNQHNQRLNLNASDSVTAEAALMVDMALLATLFNHRALLPPALSQSIGDLWLFSQAKYHQFLENMNSESPGYFKNSAEGKQVKHKLLLHKQALAKYDLAVPKNDDLTHLIVNALFKSMITGDYHNKQFGMLIQSLSVFVQPLSLAGCKSANERWQGVAGRVELLKIINQKLDQQPNYLRTALTSYIAGHSNLAEVQKELDTMYNKTNLYGTAAAVSLEDQAGATKIQSTQNKKTLGIVKEFDTNYAETGFLTNLSQRFSGNMQAHKAKLDEWFQNFFDAKSAEKNNNLSMRR